jgi:uncharacterized protein YceH (UPF0502 family)
MGFAEQAAFATLSKRVAALETELAAAKARIESLEAKRGPGRPKETQAA